MGPGPARPRCRRRQHHHPCPTPVAPFPDPGWWWCASVKCTPAPGPIRFVGLPPIISARFSVGGLRFGGAASVFLGAGGAHKYLQSVIVTLASDSATGATSVLALGSADGQVGLTLSFTSNCVVIHL